jgi:phage shock protein PspC (stress-responsive transcriptional regulator)
MIAGVAGGMAAYLNIDTAWIRLAWLAVLFLGPGVFLYIIAWIVIPEADSVAPMPVRVRDAGDNGKIIVGGLLVLGGAAMLANRFLPWMRELWLPAILIAVGTGVIIYSMRK